MNFAHIMEAHIGLAECGEKNVISVLRSRLWQGALRDVTKND